MLLYNILFKAPSLIVSESWDDKFYCPPYSGFGTRPANTYPVKISNRDNLNCDFFLRLKKESLHLRLKTGFY
jgi:hypothetical protein